MDPTPPSIEIDDPYERLVDGIVEPAYKYMYERCEGARDDGMNTS